MNMGSAGQLFPVSPETWTPAVTHLSKPHRFTTLKDPSPWKPRMSVNDVSVLVRESRRTYHPTTRC